MRIAHPRRNYSGVEIHQARRLEFVDGVAETDDSTALAAALSVKGYRRVHEDEHIHVRYAEGGVVDGHEADGPLAQINADTPTPKRKRGKTVDHSIEDDVTIDPADVERTYDD